MDENLKISNLTPVGADIDREDLIDLLRWGATNYRCGVYLHNLESIYRQQIYHELETERLEDKYNTMLGGYHFLGKDWNELFFMMFMHSLSDMDNKLQYRELAVQVKYRTILHERSSLESIEAILITASGLLSRLPKDEFTQKMRQRGEHLLRKYNIPQMSASHWDYHKMKDFKDPIIRLAQAARLLYDNAQPFNRLVNIRSRADVIALFNAEASIGWCRYFGGSKRHIGIEKSDILGINFVVPMMYAYGLYSADDELTSAANDLNESLPAEGNRYITGWKRRGLTPIAAYETQALIQLTTTYCKPKRCEECVVFRHMCSRSSILQKIPRFLEYQRSK